MENGIELKFNGFCKGCRRADLDVIELDIFGFGAQPLSSDYYQVACKHFAKCNEWNDLKNAPNVNYYQE